MKPIQMFQDIAGVLHKTAKEALKAERRYAEIKNAAKLLGGSVKDPDCSFANGGGYYQISQDNLKLFDSTFIALVKKYERSLYDIMKRDSKVEKIPISGYVGRWLDDSDSPLYSLFGMRWCVDSQGRRWGQPYYAENPDEGKQKCLGRF